MASAGMAPIARHQPLWDALCWTWRDGDAPQNYAPILADRDMPVRDLALFVHKIAHTDRLDTADKTAILSNLFESWRGRRRERPARLDGHDHRRNGTHSHARHRRSHAARRTARHRHVLSEWIWGIARDMPEDLRQGQKHNAYGVPPRVVDARPDDYQAFHTRREEQIKQWRELPEHAEAARADQADAERLEHVAGLLERVQPTPLEAEQIKRRWEPRGSPPGTSTTS